MLFKSGLPKWIEALIIKALDNSVTPADVAEAIANGKAWVIAQLRALAMTTATKFDDNIVDMIEQALTSCTDDLKFLCDLVMRGEQALVDFLREAAKKSETTIDDWAVDLLAEALGLPKA